MDPAVRGTRAVVAAAARQRVQRVVLTSSCAGTVGGGVEGGWLDVRWGAVVGRWGDLLQF